MRAQARGLVLGRETVPVRAPAMVQAQAPERAQEQDSGRAMAPAREPGLVPAPD
jgi:hypothetical protein